MPQDRAETTLVLTTSDPVSLPRIALLIQATPGLTHCIVDDVTLGSLTLRDEALQIVLGLRFVGEETRLAVEVSAAGGARDCRAVLSDISRLLSREFGAEPALETVAVAAGARPALRRTARTARPVAMMAQPALRPAARLAPVVPRRVVGGETRSDRPARVVPLMLTQPRAASPRRHRPEQQSAHVLAYESAIRTALVRPATEIEIAELGGPPPRPSTPVRLTTWAVSISVATMSLPLALPIMAHNLVRGEDMRISSLAAGVGGLFVALESSGAMASLPIF